MKDDLKHILEGVNAIIEGHFLLSNGKHTNTYVRMAQAFQHYDIAMEIAEMMSELYEDEFIDVVIGPAIGAIILAHEIGKLKEARCIYTERDMETNKMVLKRGFNISPGEKVLIVEDVFITGNSVSDIVDIVKEYGGEIVGICTAVNRNKKRRPKIKNITVKSLFHLKVEIFDEDNCPLCKEGINLEEPHNVI